MREELRKFGMEKFVDKYFNPDLFHPLKVFSAFGLNVPESELDNPIVYRAIGVAMHRELITRKRLAQYNTFEDAVCLFKESKQILVITGAGVR
jgi:NAD+-dependent protein deacetylase SIR2